MTQVATQILSCEDVRQEVAPLVQACKDTRDRIERKLNDNNIFLLRRSEWVCLANSYSFIIEKISQHLKKKEAPPQTYKIVLALNEILHTMRKGERLLQCCCLQINYIDVKVFQNWLVSSALHLSTSTVMLDTYLHELLWCYAVFHMALRETVLVSANHKARSSQNQIMYSLIVEMLCLREIWAKHSSGEDNNSLAVLEDYLLKLGSCDADEQSRKTSLLVEFIIQKWSTYVKNLQIGSPVLPQFMWRNVEEINIGCSLAAGGYGQILKANWLGGCFAVKIFSYVEDPEGILGTEAAIQARLSHPNVEHLICCAWDPSSLQVYLMMELMEQADLMLFMLKRRKAGIIPPFSLIEAVDLMLQIAKGMEYLHSLGIMHRDLKSPNILVRAIPENSETTKKIEIHLKITDFGMSKCKLASSKYSSRQVGTRGWRAPEVFEINPISVMEESQSRKYTKKADVYSFAIVCFEILSGKPPYDKDESQLESKVMNGERPTLPVYCPFVLKNLIEKCWHRDPLQRPSFTQICKTLRYLKACILLGSINELIIAPQPHYCDGEEQLKLKQLLIPIEMMSCDLDKMEELERLSTSGNSLRNHENVQEYVGKQLLVPTEMVPFTSNIEKREELGYKPNNWLISKYKKKLVNLVNLFTQSYRGTPGTQDETWLREQIQSIKMFCPRFSYKQLREATNNFNSARMVGEGRFTCVYEGELPDKTKIAVRQSRAEKSEIYGARHSRAEKSEIYGAQWILTELTIFSKIQHHPNLVQLRGCCVEDHQRCFAVYECVSNSSLDKWLFAERYSEHFLDWDTRCKIAIGTARGVKYLHEHKIIHCDIKPSNILLDDNFDAKVSDFSLAILLHEEQSEIEEAVARTIGYIDPGEIMCEPISQKVDVYSFGVTLLEVISGSRCLKYSEHGCCYLTDIAFELLEKGLLEDLIDERLKGSARKADVIRMTKIALWCAQKDSQLRPSMAQVVQMLKGETIVDDPPPSQYKKMGDCGSFNSHYHSLETEASDRYDSLFPDKFSSNCTNVI